jgi:hypothetical protein
VSSRLVPRRAAARRAGQAGEAADASDDEDEDYEGSEEAALADAALPLPLQ